MSAPQVQSPSHLLRRASRQVVGSLWFWLALSCVVMLRIEPPLREARHKRMAPQADASAASPAWVQPVMVGLGGFRGILAETLWIRAGRLQEQGRYFEQVQLAEWITALDPRATEAWSYNSWNLAYNISAMMPRFEDRLTWVNAGIALLRDRGIPINPTDARLYRELGWLFQNKIGDTMDPAHVHYQLALARNMEEVLGPDGSLPMASTPAALKLQQKYRLDWQTLGQIETTFGKLDWRLPQSQAIYWAWRGLSVAQGFEHQALRRMIHQNLITLIEHGHLSGNLAQGEYITSPNLALIAPTTAFFEETVRLYPNETRIFAYYLAFIIHLQAQAGQTPEAQQAYLRLQTLANGRYRVPAFEHLAESTERDDNFFNPLAPPSE